MTEQSYNSGNRVHLIFANVSVGAKHFGDKLSYKPTDLLSKCFAPQVRCPRGNLWICYDRSKGVEMMTVTKEVPTKILDRGSASNFTTTLKSLLELLDLEASDDYGILKPTEYAFKTAMQLLVDTYDIMGNSFPSGSESTDEEGSIFLNWISQDRKRSVILFCPCSPEKPAYVYHDPRDETAVKSDVSASKLVHWLEWFNAS